MPTSDQLLAIIADADPNADENADGEMLCDAYGPYGSCCRVRGHRDGAWMPMMHVTYERDKYDEWPVGWKSPGEKRAIVLNSNFGSQVEGSDEFLKGFQAALDLVRSALK